ncbi:hypothetical protein IE81DRAFT_143162 [Ceraceosorus guamensis]|uniref:Uncharacterized protein n=1 Tax=Ceraceosorus guamensis TaxID=1522189 RepID=A0A316VYZ8_9BASI|nr:hypothetical protein IE81DRAFT_143162 [Ceraceosorus guamensis]PWN42128.1 hypothetical protein IE81DRAFT_143162 [Ceraceosorus guamensis]
MLLFRLVKYERRGGIESEGERRERVFLHHTLLVRTDATLGSYPNLGPPFCRIPDHKTTKGIGARKLTLSPSFVYPEPVSPCPRSKRLGHPLRNAKASERASERAKSVAPGKCGWEVVGEYAAPWSKVRGKRLQSAAKGVAWRSKAKGTEKASYGGSRGHAACSTFASTSSISSGGAKE